MSDSAAVREHMSSVLDEWGFRPDGEDADLEYGGRPAWAVYFRNDDCKLQICWSAREGGVDFLLAHLGAPNELGIANSSKQWRFLLLLSDFDDGLETPSLDADADTWWDWRVKLFKIHFPAARAALLSE